MKLFLWPGQLRGTILLISFLLFGIGLLALYWGRDEVYVGVLYHFSMAPLYYVYCLWQFYLTDRLFALRRFTLFWPALLCSMIGLSALIHGITHLAPGYSHQFDFFSHFAGALFLGAFAAILRAAKQKMSKEAELAAYRAASNEAEIKLLKQQVNPHFLFNTLNSIYLKCIENKDEAGEMVQLLADLLRYQLEQGNQQTVTIGEEIGFVENYIFFEKRRLSANVAFVFEQSIDNAGQTIAPNLLITLVENAFKHGVRVGMSSAIRISVQLKGRLLQMVTVNTCLLASESQRRGTGLNNLAHRLAYLYPNRHQLDLAAENGFFKATLMIEL